MKLERIAITNYKVLQAVVLEDLTDLVVFIGPNGSGKSTLFDVFEFLSQALQGSVGEALADRGGFERVVSRGQEGAIAFSLRLRAPDGRRAEYQLRIGAPNGQVVVEHESLHEVGVDGRPPIFVMEAGKGFANVDYGGLQEHQVHETKRPDQLVLGVLGKFAQYDWAPALLDLLAAAPTIDLLSTRSAPRMAEGRLERSGGNVAAVLQHLAQRAPAGLEQIAKRLRRYVPGIEQVQVHKTTGQRLEVNFTDQKHPAPYGIEEASDGTRRLLAYLVLLYEELPRQLLCVEEPENQLHPTILPDLLEEFRLYTRRGGQVFVSTHSPELLNAADLVEVRWLEKVDGFARVRRVERGDRVWNFFNAGDPPGALWRQGLLEGADP